MSSEKIILAIDTSNYTTSVAILATDGRLIANLKRPLKVKAGERGRSVEGVDLDYRLEIFDLILVKYRGSLDLTAVCKAVANSADLGYVGNNAKLLIAKKRENELDRRLVVGESAFCLVVVNTRTLMGDNAVNSNSFTVSFCKNRAVVHIKKLILK